MNTIITSRNEILETAKRIALTEGISRLNMRALANQCGIAVGSIYNYFPTKTDLLIAIVGEVWYEIFYGSLYEEAGDSFLMLVERISDSIQKGIKTYPHFFSEHAAGIEDKGKGRGAMEQYVEHMEQVLLCTLLSDPNIKQEVWTNEFTAEKFVSFVFDFLRTDLMRGENRSQFLKELIQHSIYR